MPVKNVVQVQCECNRCGHTWTTRLAEGQLPLQCANINCHSEYWNTPRTRNVAGKDSDA
jgi:hypothetical protein